MKKRARLLELASRVETATGPDRELDYAISEAVGKGCVRSSRPLRENHAEETGGLVIPRYTASLDAALSLVPEGLVKNLGDDTGAAWAHVWKDEPAYDGMPFGARAVTLSLALTAACLRTLANQDDSK